VSRQLEDNSSENRRAGIGAERDSEPVDDQSENQKGTESGKVAQ
jgi:hypothetical protein